MGWELEQHANNIAVHKGGVGIMPPDAAVNAGAVHATKTVAVVAGANRTVAPSQLAADSHAHVPSQRALGGRRQGACGVVCSARARVLA